jgi:hypothetical protein
VIEPHGVDAGNRRFCVGVGRQQHFARVGEERADLDEQLGAGQPGHALIDEEEGHGCAARLQFARGGQRLVARGGPQHPVFRAVALAQVAVDRREHLAVIVDGENGGPDHGDFRDG